MRLRSPEKHKRQRHISGFVQVVEAAAPENRFLDRIFIGGLAIPHTQHGTVCLRDERMCRVPVEPDSPVRFSRGHWHNVRVCRMSAEGVGYNKSSRPGSEQQRRQSEIEKIRPGHGG
jgi:hypothetical protein